MPAGLALQVRGRGFDLDQLTGDEYSSVQTKPAGQYGAAVLSPLTRHRRDDDRMVELMVTAKGYPVVGSTANRYVSLVSEPTPRAPSGYDYSQCPFGINRVGNVSRSTT